MDKKEIFLLTKPPHSDRAKLCLRLMGRSQNAILYLAGDGVYTLLEASLKVLPIKSILVCREDLDARGVQAEDGVIVPSNFYEHLVKDVLSEGCQIYIF
jgi:tRNA 2-thiouridine synthesizing protein B